MENLTTGALYKEIDTKSKDIETKVIQWRRDIHAHPELSFQETRTAGLVADHLKNLGMDVQTQVGKTGVVALLKGIKKEPVVALRADMDALPVKEMTGLPFASEKEGIWNGKQVPIMHACGHDNHTAILMGAAEVLAGMRDKISGTIKFIFQPCEEEFRGAAAMIADGALENPKPEAIFALHVAPYPSGMLAARGGSSMASADEFKIVVKGTQTHASSPWSGVDPIVISSQIIQGLQTLVSRKTDLLQSPLVISIGQIHGGVRSNILPDKVEMEGTMRTFDEGIRANTKESIEKMAKALAEASGATAEVFFTGNGCPLTFNQIDLFAKMEPTLKRVSKEFYMESIKSTGAEDFAFFQEKIPGLYFFLGSLAENAEAHFNHSPYFTMDEKSLIVGVRAMVNLAIDYLNDSK